MSVTEFSSNVKIGAPLEADSLGTCLFLEALEGPLETIDVPLEDHRHAWGGETDKLFDTFTANLRRVESPWTAVGSASKALRGFSLAVASAFVASHGTSVAGLCASVKKSHSSYLVRGAIQNY